MAYYEKGTVVEGEQGIHARPSTLIVEKVLASGCAGKVFVKREEEEVKFDPSGIMSIMMLAATYGTKLIVFTEHNECKGFVDELAEFIRTVGV